MIKIPCRDTHYWMDGLLKANLDIAKQVIKDDWDFLWVVDGDVGSGKSVFAQQVAFYLSENKLKLENICFTAEEFRTQILKAKKYDCIIFDEAFRGLSGRTSLSKINKSIVELLNEIRQKNLYVLIVLPSMWDLDKYVTMHRCQGVFHVFHVKKRKENGNIFRQRGHVRFFNGSSIRYFIGNNKIKYVYPKDSNMKVTFRNFYPIDENEYRSKKDKALAADSAPPVQDDKWQVRCSRLITLILARKWVSQRQLAEILGYSRESLRKWSGVRPNGYIINPQGEAEVHNVEVV